MGYKQEEMTLDHSRTKTRRVKISDFSKGLACSALKQGGCGAGLVVSHQLSEPQFPL